MSSVESRASAPLASPEAVLFRGYGLLKPGAPGMMRVCVSEAPCACGGSVAVSGLEAVERAVNTHNATALHAAWRAWRELA